MTKKAEPVVIDFSKVLTPDEQYQATLTALRGARPRIRPYIAGSMKAHTQRVPEWRLKRARRILWECSQQPDWARSPVAFFKHPSLKNVPYVVLKRLYNESERTHA